MTFQELNIIQPILRAIHFEGYTSPTPIQEQAIPVLFEGRDILGSAQTGTGKTAAFAVPIIQALYKEKKQSYERPQIQALILAPTRELAEQIKDSFRSYSKDLGIKTEVLYGGVSQRPQVASLQKGVDVLIATPGRLLDLMNQGYVNLSYVKYLVLDEADRMLDMGFIIDVNRIVAKIPTQRQTMLFSATIPHEIMKLANSLLTDPVRVSVTPPETTLEAIKQSLYHVTKKDKTNLLIDILTQPSTVSLLVFTRTKHGANKLVKELLAYGVKADAIHGNKSQAARQNALRNFKGKKLRVLVATDIAARGIDIDELSHVVNYDLPESAETYIHRIGRTGRAGLFGTAFTFCSEEEGHLLKAIEKHIKMNIPLNNNHPFIENFTGLHLNGSLAKKGNTSNRPYKAKSNGEMAKKNTSYNRFDNKKPKSAGSNTQASYAKYEDKPSKNNKKSNYQTRNKNSKSELAYARWN